MRIRSWSHFFLVSSSVSCWKETRFGIRGGPWSWSLTLTSYNEYWMENSNRHFKALSLTLRLIRVFERRRRIRKWKEKKLQKGAGGGLCETTKGSSERQWSGYVLHAQHSLSSPLSTLSFHFSFFFFPFIFSPSLFSLLSLSSSSSLSPSHLS